MSYNSEPDSGGRFNFFSWMSRDGRGVDPGERPVMENPGIKNFFKLFGRNFNRIVTLNLMMIVGNFPIFFALAVMTGYFSYSSTSPAYTLFAQLNGAMMHGGGAFASAIAGAYSVQSPITVLSTTDYVFLALTCLLLLTMGPVMVGSSYIMRNIVREEPIFMLHDFFYAIRRNLRQSILFGIADVLIIGFIAYDIVFFNVNYHTSIAVSIMFFAAIFLAVIYFIMRMYIYIMMLTFDLSILKILKNALIFTVLAIKRDAAALLGCALLVLINAALLSIYYPIGVILPFVIVFSLALFMTTYAAYPVIDKYMIAPYYKKNGSAEGSDAECADGDSLGEDL